MKTLFLHIGTPKTATTSLQHFCRDNGEVLQQHRFIYPDFPYKYAHINKVRNGHFLVGAMPDGKQLEWSSEDAEHFQEGMEAIRKYFKEYDNVILSDEGIWTRNSINQPGLWERLKKESVDGGFQIRIVVYLRRQDEYAASWWNQKVKMGKRKHSTVSWDDFVEQEVPSMGLDYYSELQKISNVFGKENVIVRRFGKQYFKNHSIYEDFFQVLGLELTEDYVIGEPTRNESLSGNSLEIKRILNSLPNLEPKDNVFLREIMAEVSDAVPENKKLTLFTEKEAEEFLMKYQEGNQKVREEYMGKEGNLFDMTFKKATKWEPECSSMERDMIIFMGNIAMQFRNENELLRKNQMILEQELNRQKHTIDNLSNKIKHPIKTVLGRAVK